jgi:APA family basic amino acid/polyamine antiporter
MNARGSTRIVFMGTASFAYAIANASAFTQTGDDRRWPRWLQVLGMAGCAILALALPIASVLAGTSVLAVGAIVWAIRLRARS